MVDFELFIEEVVGIRKIVILNIADSEEYAIDKLKELFGDENSVEYVDEISESVLSFQGVKVNVRSETVSLRANPIELSHREFSALHFLVKHPGWIFTKKQIYDAVCGEKNVEDVDNAVYCLIRNIRKRLETDPHHPKYIQTVRVAGYKFVIQRNSSLGLLI